MADDLLRYHEMVERAMRGVVREALTEIAENGLPGEHHFYITFRTTAPGVEVSERVRAQNPDEMTIVLQHQFWGLEVADDAFGVTLSFGGVSERLHVPLDAVVGFVDPSVTFGLQFGGGPTAPGGEDAKTDDAPKDAKEDAGEETGEGAGEIVALDSFRKK